MKKILLFFILLSVFCLAQERIRDEKSIMLQEKERLLSDKTTIESKLAEISASPVSFANKRIQELNGWIQKLPDRKAKFEGNITMKEYLRQLKDEVEKSPGDYVSQEIQKLINQKAQIEAQINEIDKIDDNTAIETDKEIKDVKEGK